MYDLYKFIGFYKGHSKYDTMLHKCKSCITCFDCEQDHTRFRRPQQYEYTNIKTAKYVEFEPLLIP